MSSLGASNPWENAWTAEDAGNYEQGKTGDMAQLDSGFVERSYLFRDYDDHGDESGSTGKKKTSPSISDMPTSLTSVLQFLKGKIETRGDIETLVLKPLVSSNIFTSFQGSTILNVIDENVTSNFGENLNLCTILGLVALEIETPGSGNYLALQVRLDTLPEFPADVVELIREASYDDPLTSQLNRASLSDDNGSQDWSYDNSNIAAQDINRVPSYEFHDNEELDDRGIEKYISGIRSKVSTLLRSDTTIRIREIPEKEGLIFKHINYIITHDLHLNTHAPKGTKRVIRRYSDFVWLLEYLLGKYPFRLIPGLPPKKLTVRSSSDPLFLQRRRRSLQRFLNQLVRHPSFRQEPVVVSFLSVPTDLTNWRRQAKIDYSIEFKGLKTLTFFINSVWPSLKDDFLKNWGATQRHIGTWIVMWTKIVMLIERYEKRQQQIASDKIKFASILSNMTSFDHNIYPHDDAENSKIADSNRADMVSLNQSLGQVSTFFTKSSQNLIEESYAINTSVLETFKSYLDYLYSLQEFYERTKRLLANNIVQLQSHIQECEKKYATINSEDADARGTKLSKLKQTLINEKQELFQQLNRDWLIKNCVLEEYLLFQETHYFISLMWAEWCKGRINFHDKQSSAYDILHNLVEDDLPFSS